MNKERKVTVYYNGSALVLFKTIADKYKLRDGYQIRSKEDLELLVHENSTYGIMLCQMMLDITENQNN